jgi:hypothetical protein
MQEEHIDFGSLREFCEAGLQPKTNRDKFPNLTKTARSFKSLIDILASLVTAPPNAFVAQVTKGKLDIVEAQIHKATLELAQEEQILPTIRKEKKRIHSHPTGKWRKCWNNSCSPATRQG